MPEETPAPQRQSAKERNVGIGASVFLMAVGAVLTFALEANLEGIDLDTVGIILMIAGALGLLVSLVVWRDGAPWATRDRTVVREEHLL
jgi:hypothetical protein